jgi:hypothetical protein
MDKTQHKHDRKSLTNLKACELFMMKVIEIELHNQQADSNYPRDGNSIKAKPMQGRQR